LFGSVRQIKLAVRQLLGAHKYSLSYSNVSYRNVITSELLTDSTGHFLTVWCCWARSNRRVSSLGSNTLIAPFVHGGLTVHGTGTLLISFFGQCQNYEILW